ncbi:uncharacterized protein TOT_040000222 [Theileria orientalis strain Shintoku]|uniref:BSD domain-containing protein n=1 Tax=Theileria orientalis strain Shintoku TaxID=869250 RepID=J4CDW3_THEOR|nr:uncharacterized protein TOT_040000222 [Theileria orientalis strain Shintoku]PVC50361.1 hypothetical protein MACL_00002324 [Theileria orientalis]BAM41842.1 uncharacterized protein TOT_040000222 [Theileria orientalis strain Shintoku]|eukprot:XP_009692143.1 uncharacterized protein TOT_040000222 [Theileria orientalis strain Shintoku]
MVEFEYENVQLDGVDGTCVLNDFDLLFSVSNSVYKWSLSNWTRSEKSKKTAKVRLTFKESSVRLSPESSDFDSLIKPIIIVDFNENRDKLEQFCDFIANVSNKSRKVTYEAQSPQEGLGSQSNDFSSQISTFEKIVADEIDQSKRVLLNSSVHLSTLYNTLISPVSDYHGYITPKDFWDHHKLELTSKFVQPLARSNLEGFVAVPPASTVVNSQNVYNYTPELVEALLTEDETIRHLHKKLVVEKNFPEENFWKRMLQSRYFYNLIGEKVPENQIVYDDIKGIPIKRTLKRVDTNEVLTSSDLSSELITFLDSKKTKRNNKFLNIKHKFGKTFKPDDTRELLVQRFNRHSYNIIRDSQSNVSDFSNSANNGADSNSLESEVEKHRKIKLLDVSEKDLQEKDRQELISNLCIITSLSMPGQTQQQAKHLVKSESTESVNKIQFKIRQSSLTEAARWVNDLRHFDVSKYLSDYKNDDLVNRRMFVLNTKLCQSEKLMQLAQFDYDPSTVNRMKEIQKEIVEILQIYYRTLMPEEDKRGRLLTVLRSIKQKIESMNDAGISSHTAKALQSSLLDQITAVEAYDMKLRSYLSSLRSQRAK